ncbi:MAG: VCBS domain-containing protein, partial [Rhodocyclaceae bacterium]|nr:VCBS domain-containing protein [Rhodocyclaceae bacterium]
DNTNPTVNALKDGESKTDSYEYTLTDGDGSTTKATLTITIKGSTEGVPTIDVPDDNLAGQGDGDKTVAETDVAIAGNFSITAPAGLKQITLGSTTVSEAELVNLSTTPVTLVTDKGTLVLTGYDASSGQVSYTYDPKILTHTDGESLIDRIALTVTDDLDISGTPNSLDINITDSQPVAKDDVNSITEDGTPNTVDGNVLTGAGADTVGGDSNANPVTAANVTLTYGSLQLNSDGSYTYTLDNTNPTVNALKDGESKTDSYEYTLTDGDGSTTKATLTITIKGKTETVLEDGDETKSVAEDTTLSVTNGAEGDLLNNSSVVGGTPTITGYSIDGVSGTQAVGSNVDIDKVGTLNISADGSYSFTPVKDYSGAVPVITYTVSNGQGGTDTSTLNLSVTPVADTPKVTVDIGSATEMKLSGTINKDNYASINSGYTVVASSGTVSTNGSPNGFGVAGDVIGNKSNATSEIQSGTSGESEKLLVTFTNPTRWVDVKLAWLASGEDATIKLYGQDGSVILTKLIDGGTDGVDTLSRFEPTTDLIKSIEFSAPTSSGGVNDYLVNSISFESVVSNNYPLTITATPIDIDYSETISTIKVVVPEGATLSDGTKNVDGTWTLSLVSDGAYVVSVNSTTKAVEITGLSITMPASASGVQTLTVTATALDGADTADGSASISFGGDSGGGGGAGSAPIAVDDNLSGTEDTVRVISAADLFGADGTGSSNDQDTDSSSFSNITITALGSNGTLLLNDVPVSLNQSVSLDDINAGSLKFVPQADFSGQASFHYTVTDSSGKVSNDATVNLAISPVADTPTVYAHVTSLGFVASSTSIFSDNFNSGLTTGAWTPNAIRTNTFAEVSGGNGKTSTELALFNSVAWAGQTGGNTNEEANFSSRWTSPTTNSDRVDGTRFAAYNVGGSSGSDDAQGFLQYTGSDLTVAEKTSKNYVIDVQLFAQASSPQANGVGFIFGYSDDSNFFLARWENPSSDYAPNGELFNQYPGQYQQLSLVQVSNGTVRDLATTSFNGSDWFNLRIAVSDTGIAINAGDVDKTSITVSLNYTVTGVETTPALGEVGFYTFDNDSKVAFDNLTISAQGTYRYTLNTEAFLGDIDGSESLSSIALSGIPDGVLLSDASNGAAIQVVGGAATVGVGQSVTMQSASELTAGQINGIIAKVTATETTGGASATDTDNVKLDTVAGTDSDDWLQGGNSADSISGAAGNDVLLGGQGNDTLDGGAGADVIRWRLGETGTDTVQNFGSNAGTDVLDLRDLLPNSGIDAASLDAYLNFSKQGSDTVIDVKPDGTNVTQKIVLEGVDLVSTGGSDVDIISDLISKGKLITD